MTLSYTIAAPAKINLALRVLGKRPDFYHDLCTLVAFADFADFLDITFAAIETLAVTGPYARALADLPMADNLVMKTLAAYRMAGGDIPPLAMILHKHIPPQTGLGGGTADAMALLRFLRGYGRHPAGLDFMALAARIGADGPMCFLSRPLLATGLGDKILPLRHWPKIYGILCWPENGVATQAAFAQIRNFSPLPDWAAQTDWDFARIENLLAADNNDFYAALSPAYPDWVAARKNLQTLPELLGCGLSGSGSAQFALFTTRRARDEAAQKLSLPTSWQWRGFGG
jgi:4-diphosphocytidyl-2-C-methyl-D-erythritol kinase